jgi:triosephosphate isomerase (TIM)
VTVFHLDGQNGKHCEERMTRRPLIAGNWKMNLTLEGSVTLAREIVALARRCTDRDIMIAPPYTALSAVSEAIKGSGLILGAQNVAWEKEGAYTGEISPLMLRELGVTMVIVGHSERRHIFGEDNLMINHRLLSALQGGLVPVFCVGETLDDREAGATFSILETQVCEGLENVRRELAAEVVFAYEPVWAIGTGKTASVEQAQEVHGFLRDLLAGLYEKNLADHARILYGGSVKPDNIDGLIAQPDIDGALVGGAALKSASFERIVCFQ